MIKVPRAYELLLSEADHTSKSDKLYGCKYCDTFFARF